MRRYAWDIITLGLRPEVKVTVTKQMVHDTLHPKIHPHTDFGIPAFNSVGGLLQYDVKTQALRMDIVIKY